MPVSYPMPNWVGPQATAMWADIYQQGARQGFQRAQLAAQARAQAAQEAEFEAEMRARAEAQHERQLRDQQELEIDSAYKSSVISLKARELEQDAKEAQSKILQTAEQAAGRLTLSQKLSAATTPDERMNVLMQYGIPGGVTPTAIAESIRAFDNRARAPVAADWEPVNYGGRQFLKDKTTGKLMPITGALPIATESITTLGKLTTDPSKTVRRPIIPPPTQKGVRVRQKSTGRLATWTQDEPLPYGFEIVDENGQPVER